VYEISPARKTSLDGTDVLLIDDVLTTGATVNACSRSLIEGGAAKVDVLTFSRVVRASNTAI
jgi:predicted amidophosphoribosyltransferase